MPGRTKWSVEYNKVKRGQIQGQALWSPNAGSVPFLLLYKLL